MVCRIGRMASVGRRACLYRFARPLPLGAGDYVRPAGFGLVCGEGVGVFSRFFYLLARRRVISSSSVVGLLASPFFLCRHRPVPPSSSPLGLLASPFPVSSLSHRPSRLVLSRPSALLSVFSCGFLSPPPFLRRAGRGVLCLLASFVVALVPPSPCLLVLVDRPHPSPSHAVVVLSSSSPLLVSRRRSHLVRVAPFFDKRGRGAWRLVLCLLASFVLGCGFPSCVRAVSSGDVSVSAWVVFGLWCRCLYI